MGLYGVDKLAGLGVNQMLILWINSFLTNRTQQVRFNSVTSASRPINIGAPQGCVLSPLLYTFYTRDARGKLDRGPEVRPQGAGLHFWTEKAQH